MKKMNANPQISNVKYLDDAHFVPPLPRKKNNTLVSENAGDGKNLHPGGRKKTFFLSI